MRTNTEMRAIQIPSSGSSSRAPTVPLTARAAAKALPAPGPGHRRMSVFVGTWCAEGHGICTGEWLAGEHTLLLRWNHRLGDAGARDLWVLSLGATHYALHRFDDAGRAIAYQASVAGDEWTINGADQRAVITFTDGGATMRQQWWRRDGEEWREVCDVAAIRG